MGIYSDGNIYGVSFYKNEVNLYEKSYNHIITLLEIQDVKEYYDTLTSEEKDALTILFYKSCSSTYLASKENSFMAWFPGRKATLETLFGAV